MIERISRGDQILQALMKMLEGQALNRITTAALAKQVGVSEAALYRHFSSKAQMYDALIDFVESSLFSTANEVQKSGDGALVQCEKILHYILALVEKNRGLCRLLTGEALLGEKDRLGERVDKIFEKFQNIIKRMLRDAEIKEGLRTNANPSVCANLLVSHVEGRLRQYSRTGFKQLPTQDWALQWPMLSAQIMRS